MKKSQVGTWGKPTRDWYLYHNNHWFPFVLVLFRGNGVGVSPASMCLMKIVEWLTLSCMYLAPYIKRDCIYSTDNCIIAK